MAMEACSEGKLFFEQQDFEGLLEAVRSSRGNVQEEPVQVPEEKKEQGPIHLVIDNMPKVVQTQAPVQAAIPINPLSDLPASSPFEEPKKTGDIAVTPEEVEKEARRKAEERRKKREEKRRAEALNN